MEAYVLLVGLMLLIGICPTAYFQLKALHRIERKLNETVCGTPKNSECQLAEQTHGNGHDDGYESKQL